MVRRLTSALGIAALYRVANHAHSALPYRLSRAGRALPAWHYFFEVTRRCNLRCRMCQYIDWLTHTPAREQSEGELTTAEWLGVIDQTSRYGLITFTGGEVFVRKDFMTIFEHACARRRVHFITNATMLTEERARRCAELAARRLGGRGFNVAGISLDGTRDVHDVIRAQQGAFDRSMRGIRMLVRFRDQLGKACPLIHINTVIQEANLDVLPDMPAVAAEAGANVLNLLTEFRSFDLPDVGHVDPASYGPDAIRLPVIDRGRLDEAIRRTLRNAERVGIQVRLPRMPYEDVLNHYGGGYDLAGYECRAIWSNLYVGSKGGVYPCFIHKIGNVRDTPLNQLWNQPAARAFRRRRREGAFAVCRGCCEIEHPGYRRAGLPLPRPDAESAPAAARPAPQRKAG